MRLTARQLVLSDVLQDYVPVPLDDSDHSIIKFVRVTAGKDFTMVEANALIEQFFEEVSNDA